MTKQVGKTKDVGFVFGLRKTFPVSVQQAWNFMFSDQGLSIWLGDLITDFELKKEYSTKEGIEGIVRVLKPDSHVRMGWKKEGWTNMSTVQVRFIAKGLDKTVISFLHEKLTGAQQRAEMKEYWNQKMDLITKALDAMGN